MTAEEKNLLKAKLNADIAALKKQIVALQENIQPFAKDCCLDEVARTELHSDQEVSRKILQTSALRLSQLQHALQRIDTPMFGICIECGEEIGFGRMLIRPESVRCVECAN